jgi:hypothetical protein
MNGELLPALRSEDGNVIRIGEHSGPAEPPAGYTVERQEPQRGQTLEGAFYVPLAQALATALVVIMSLGMLAWVFGWRWTIPVAVTAITLLAAWLWRLRHSDRLLWRTETWIRRDLNGDGVIGQPMTGFTLLNPDVARRAVAAAEAAQTVEDRRQELYAFVDRCFLIGSSEFAQGIRASGPDRERYVRCRDALIDLGIGRWKSPGRPTAGWLVIGNPAAAKRIIDKHVL